MRDDLLDDHGTGNRFEWGDDAQLLSRLTIEGDGNAVRLGDGAVLDTEEAAAGGTSIRVCGHRNTILIGKGARVRSNLQIEGDDCRLVIGDDCILAVTGNLRARGVIDIGAGTTMVGAALHVHETATIAIGRDCMISKQVYLSVSDMHPIRDRATGQRINPAASITVGDHVWLGVRAMIMKGARIDDGAVVAAASVVTGHVPGHTIVAGTPARVQRENVVWDRDFGEPGC